jgi:2-keto-4-pentenoate hydratase
MTASPEPVAAAKQLGNRLADAERLGRSVSLAELTAAGLVADTLAAGMAGQAAFVTASGRDVAGWKVGINGEGVPVAAPMLDLYAAGDDGRAEVTRPGVKAIEPEICFRLSSDLPPPEQGRSLKREDVLGKIGSIHFGAELIGFRIAEENNVPFPLFLADRLGNHSFVVGPEIDRNLFAAIAAEDNSLPGLSLKNGDEILFSGRPRHPQRDPLIPMLAYANNPNDQLGGLRRGQLVTTGSLCGVVAVRSGAQLEVCGFGLPAMRIAIP